MMLSGLGTVSSVVQLGALFSMRLTAVPVAIRLRSERYTDSP
jgi:hypothetical protein